MATGDEMDVSERQRQRKARREANQQPQTTQQPQSPISLTPPAFGYEQYREERINAGGGATIDGRKRNPKVAINRGQDKGLTPGERENRMRADYAAMNMGGKDGYTAKAEGADIRTPNEIANQAQFDQSRAQILGLNTGTQTAMTPPGGAQPSAAPKQQPISMGTSTLAGASGVIGASGLQGARGLGNAPMGGGSMPAAPSWEGKNAAATFRAKAQTAMAMNSPAMARSVDETTSDITRNASGEATKQARMQPKAPLVPAKGPDSLARPQLEANAPTPKRVMTRDEAKSEIDKSIAGRVADLTSNSPAPQPPTGKAAPIPDPSPAVRSAAKAFARGEVNRNFIEHPLLQPVKTALGGGPSTADYKPKSFLDSPEYAAAKTAPTSAPVQSVAQGRAGKPAGAPPTVESMVEKAIGKPVAPTQFAPIASTGGRKGAAPRVPMTPPKTPSQKLTSR